MENMPDFEPKFIVDENVIKLGRWLRMLGFDAAFYPISSDDDLVRIAIKEDRIILTRDRHLLERKAKCFMVRNTDPLEQLKEVIETFNLKVSRERFLSRCLDCNVLIEEVRDKREVRNLVPPYVYVTQVCFYRCPRCGKVFWEGTHVKNMRRKLESIISRYTEIAP
ncbi:TPA: hypothetical protein EYP37_12625 [Candidatus Poribacteria bacterium]|nr:hypothetical protein [Candidatus Poribacteria bacterium]